MPWHETGDHEATKVSHGCIFLNCVLLFFRELQGTARTSARTSARTKVASPTIIKSNPVFQYAGDENVSQLVLGKTRSREEDMKHSILELAQLGIVKTTELMCIACFPVAQGSIIWVRGE